MPSLGYEAGVAVVPVAGYPDPDPYSPVCTSDAKTCSNACADISFARSAVSYFSLTCFSASAACSSSSAMVRTDCSAVW